jgi:hypothetical protein
VPLKRTTMPQLHVMHLQKRKQMQNIIFIRLCCLPVARMEQAGAVHVQKGAMDEPRQGHPHPPDIAGGPCPSCTREGVDTAALRES